MLHKITLGDWSGDGHGITQDYFFETADQFTDEVLGANYDKNIVDLGINPSKLMDSPDEYEIPVAVKQKLQSLDIANLSKPVNPKYDEPWWDPSEEYADFGPDGMARLILFLVGYGLDGFDYEFVTVPSLIGGGKSSTPSVGYTLFMD